jgi:hypothetical protein
MIILVLLLAILPFVTFAQTEFEGEVSGEWTTEGSPYIQVGEAEIPAEESLTILPGVEVILGEDLTLTCNGVITAQGTEDDTIRIHGQEGLISGTLLIDAEEDTARFAYCRFDSLAYGIGILNASSGTPIEITHSLFNNNFFPIDLPSRWIRVVSCSFISDTLEHGPNMHIGSNAEPMPELVIFTDNRIRGINSMGVQFAAEAIFTDNVAEQWFNREIEWYSDIIFFSCGRVIFRNNVDFGVLADNQFRRLEEAVFEENNGGAIGVSCNGNWGAIIRNNQTGNISVSYAYAEVMDNHLEIIDTYIRADGDVNFTDAVAVFDHNFLRCGEIGGDCDLELTNNTFVVEDGVWDDFSILRESIIDDIGDLSLTLRNNILVSLPPVVYAIAPEIDVEDGGFNCFYGIEDAYGSRGDLLEGDIVEDPLFVGGNPPEYYLQANSPCIDTGDPDSPRDPDGTRADMGCYFFDQENGMPPAIISEHEVYIGNRMTLRYVARATDEGDHIDFEFDNLPDWLEIEEDNRDFVSDSIVVTGEVPDEQEDFVFVIHAIDEDEMEDTLSVQILTYPFTVLTGHIGGYLSRENSPYLVADTAWVAEDDSLIIEPGCVIYCDDTIDGGRYHSVLMSNTYVKAIGTEEDSIFFNTLNGTGSRRLIQISGNSDETSEFKYCHFNGAGVRSYDQNASITNCHTENAGLYLLGEEIRFDFQDNTGWGGSFRGTGQACHNQLKGNITIGGDSIEVFDNYFKKGSISTFGGGVRNGYIHHNIMDSVYSNAISISNYLEGETSHIKIVSNTFGNGSNGILIQGENANMNIQNNLINNLQGWGFQMSEYDYNALITNNVISNSAVAFYIRNRDGEYMNNYRTENNLFINNDTLLQLRMPNQVYKSFIYNSCFDFDSLGNDTSYIGRLTQVNANGDSCDAGFNIFLDPHIASLDTLDFRLYADSPLIDAGNPDSVFFDVDGSVNDIGLYGGPFGAIYLHPQNVGMSDIPVPEGFSLERPYPNPFNISTNFTFSLPAPGKVDINIYDTIGRLIFSDKLEELQAGSHRYTWHGIDNRGRPLPTGIYYFELTFKGAKLVKRVVLLK